MVFNWTHDCRLAFQQPKKALTSSPILVMQTENGTFILDTDASNLALSSVLSEKVNGGWKRVERRS